MKKIHPQLGLCCSFCGEPKPDRRLEISEFSVLGFRSIDEIYLHKQCWQEIKNTIKQLHRAIL